MGIVKNALLMVILSNCPLPAQTATAAAPKASALSDTTKSTSPQCSQHYTYEGPRIIGEKTYKSYQVYPKLDRDLAMERVAQGLALDGWEGVSVNKDAGVLAATQKRGIGQPPINIIVKRESPEGVRIDLVFKVHQDWLAKDAMKGFFCKILGFAEDAK